MSPASSETIGVALMARAVLTRHVGAPPVLGNGVLINLRHPPQVWTPA
jgi:hypothetical protein